MTESMGAGEIARRIKNIGEGGRVTFVLDGISVPTKPFDGISYSHKETPYHAITGKLVMIDDDDPEITARFDPDRDERERIGLDTAARHDSADGDQAGQLLEIFVQLELDRQPGLEIPVPTGGQWAERHHRSGYAVGTSPPLHKLGTVQAIYSEPDG